MPGPLLFFFRRTRQLLPLLICSLAGALALSMIAVLADTVLSGKEECYAHFRHLSTYSFKGGVSSERRQELADILAGQPEVISLVRADEWRIVRKLPLGSEQAFVYRVDPPDVSRIADHIGYRLVKGRWPEDGQIVLSSSVALAAGLRCGDQVGQRLHPAPVDPTARVSGIMSGPGFLALYGQRPDPADTLMALVVPRAGPLLPANWGEHLASHHNWSQVGAEITSQMSFLRWVFVWLTLAVGLPLALLSALATYFSIRSYAADLAVLRVIGLPRVVIFLRTVSGFSLPILAGFLVGVGAGLAAGAVLVGAIVRGTGISPGVDMGLGLITLTVPLVMILMCGVVTLATMNAWDPIRCIEAGREVLDSV